MEVYFQTKCIFDNSKTVTDMPINKQKIYLQFNISNAIGIKCLLCGTLLQSRKIRKELRFPDKLEFNETLKNVCASFRKILVKAATQCLN